MKTIAKLTPGLISVQTAYDVPDDQSLFPDERLVDNGTQPPSTSNLKYITMTGWVITATHAIRQWAELNHPQSVIDYINAQAADVNERTVLRSVIAALQNGTGTAAERLARLERVVVYLIRHL